MLNRYRDLLREQLLVGEINAGTLGAFVELFREQVIRSETDVYPKPQRKDPNAMYTACWDLVTAFLVANQKFKELTEFQLKMCGLQFELQDNILLELCLTGIIYGSVNDTYEQLLTYIHVHPYIDNPVLLGYAGLLAYFCHKGDTSDRYYMQARTHFMDSLTLNNRNPLFFTACYDMFNEHDDTLSIEKLMTLVKPSECDDVFFMYLELDYQGFEQIVNIDLILKIMRCDPMYDIRLLEQLCDRKLVSGRVLAELAATRLEYEKNSLLAWITLCNNLDRLNESYWSDRKHWWPYFHCFPYSSSFQPDLNLMFFQYVWAAVVIADQVKKWNWDPLHTRTLKDCEKALLLQYGIAIE